jgi:hypothetical protein
LEKTSWLVIIAEEKHQKDIGKVLHDNGFKVWTDRPFNGLNIFHISGPEQTIKRIGCMLVGLSHSFPNLRIELIDHKGFI